MPHLDYETPRPRPPRRWRIVRRVALGIITVYGLMVVLSILPNLRRLSMAQIGGLVIGVLAVGVTAAAVRWWLRT